MDRDRFILGVVAALQQRDAASSSGAVASTARRVHEQLCHDYPTVTDTELSVLAEAVDKDPTHYLTAEFVHGVTQYALSSAGGGRAASAVVAGSSGDPTIERAQGGVKESEGAAAAAAAAAAASVEGSLFGSGGPGGSATFGNNAGDTSDSSNSGTSTKGGGSPQSETSSGEGLPRLCVALIVGCLSKVLSEETEEGMARHMTSFDPPTTRGAPPGNADEVADSCGQTTSGGDDSTRRATADSAADSGDAAGTDAAAAAAAAAGASSSSASPSPDSTDPAAKERERRYLEQRCDEHLANLRARGEAGEVVGTVAGDAAAEATGAAAGAVGEENAQHGKGTAGDEQEDAHDTSTATIQGTQVTQGSGRENAEEDEVWASESDPDDFEYEDGRPDAVDGGGEGSGGGEEDDAAAAVLFGGSAGAVGGVLGRAMGAKAEVAATSSLSAPPSSPAWDRTLVLLETSLSYDLVGSGISVNEWNAMDLTPRLVNIAGRLIQLGSRASAEEERGGGGGGGGVDDAARRAKRERAFALASRWVKALQILRDRVMAMPSCMADVLPAIMSLAVAGSDAGGLAGSGEAVGVTWRREGVIALGDICASQGVRSHAVASLVLVRLLRGHGEFVGAGAGASGGRVGSPVNSLLLGLASFFNGPVQRGLSSGVSAIEDAAAGALLGGLQVRDGMGWDGRGVDGRRQRGVRVCIGACVSEQGVSEPGVGGRRRMSRKADHTEAFAFRCSIRE
jgi:hypothetical protein